MRPTRGSEALLDIGNRPRRIIDCFANAVGGISALARAACSIELLDGVPKQGNAVPEVVQKSVDYAGRRGMPLMFSTLGLQRFPYASLTQDFTNDNG